MQRNSIHSYRFVPLWNRCPKRDKLGTPKIAKKVSSTNTKDTICPALSQSGTNGTNKNYLFYQYIFKIAGQKTGQNFVPLRDKHHVITLICYNGFRVHGHEG